MGLSPIKGIGTSLLRNITANKAERNHHRSNTQNQWKETKHYLSRQQESFWGSIIQKADLYKTITTIYSKA